MNAGSLAPLSWWPLGGGQVGACEGRVGSRWLWELEVTVSVCLCSVATEVADREPWGMEDPLAGKGGQV